MYKKILLIASIFFFFNANYAFASPGLFNNSFIDTLVMVPVVIFFAIGFIFAGGLFIIGGVLFIPVSLYYYSVEVINNKNHPEFIEVRLCPAALDLELDIDKDFKNRDLVTPFYNKDIVKLLDNMPALPTPEKQINKEFNAFCVNCEKKYYADFINTSESVANGIWKPIQAFTYQNVSYINLIQFNEDRTYKTMIAEFRDIYQELTYNKQYIFESTNQTDRLYKKANVRNLCTYLKEKSIHELKTR